MNPTFTIITRSWVQKPYMNEGRKNEGMNERGEPDTNQIYFYVSHRDWSPKFETGLNIIIATVQKV